MATATHSTLRPVAPPRSHSDIHVLANPLAQQDPALARAVEDTLYEMLGPEALGRLEVRFRVCRELAEGLRFICKIENPPVAGLEPYGMPWRWWSPLMETAQDFRTALQEALLVRSARLADLHQPAF